MELKKTTIRIPKNLYIKAKKKAVEQGIPLQEYVRIALDMTLRLKMPLTPADENQGRKHAKALLKLAAEAKKRNVRGPKDLASNIDEYLYGSKRIE